MAEEEQINLERRTPVVAVVDLARTVLPVELAEAEYA
jgi:hypothetical protein